MAQTRRLYDIRLRPPYGGFLECVMYKNRERSKANMAARGMKAPGAIDSLDPEDTIREYVAAGGVRALVPARVVGNPVFDGVSNEDCLEIAERWPDLYKVAIAVDPFGGKAAVDEIRRHADNPAVVSVVVEPGIMAEPGYLDDPRIDPVWEECQGRGMPVLAMGGGNAGPDIGYASPVALDRVAVRFPKLQIVAAHGGWPYVTEMLGCAFRRPNVHVSPDLYLVNCPGWQDYVEAANSYLQDRFLFATAYPFNDFADYAEKMEKLPFRRDVLDKVFYANAARLFGE